MAEVAATGNGGTEPTRKVELTPSEVRLLRTALSFLVATLTREEADELDAAQALLDKLSDPDSAR